MLSRPMLKPALMIHRPIRIATIGSKIGKPRLENKTPIRTAPETSTSLR